MINPGEIYMADLNQTYPHPVFVVSREELNRGDYVVAVVITSARFAVRSQLPNCVPFRAGEFGLTKDCVAQAETITNIPTDQLDLAGGPVGTLDDMRMRDLVRAIGNVISSDCEPV
jgi:mRNA-degrading endonuclease toxin of MazEF toxin-antitoxin module